MTTLLIIILVLLLIGCFINKAEKASLPPEKENFKLLLDVVKPVGGSKVLKIFVVSSSWVGEIGHICVLINNGKSIWWWRRPGGDSEKDFKSEKAALKDMLKVRNKELGW